jgi:tRNA (cytidine/uridine-2'-O-)-methyltransferase
MRLALYQPDIPQNAGTILRLGACLGVPVDIIEPCGFLFDDRRLRRAGLDYAAQAAITLHRSWLAYQEARRSSGTQGRLLLLTTSGSVDYAGFAFAAGDTLLVGRESAGVPEEVHAAADARLAVPMCPGLRSLNVALAAAMVLGEALRQTQQFPSGETS